jgi:cobalt-zinc-cadmium efflux system membrane fusion protein
VRLRLAVLLALLPWVLATARADPGAQVVTLSPDQQHTIGLKTAQVQARPITEMLHVPATVEFDPARVATLRPLVAARVTALLVQPGEVVRAGQVLARLQIPSLVDSEARLADAASAEKAAEVELMVAQEARRRAAVLVKDGYFARAEEQRRRGAEAEAEAQLAGARDRKRALQIEVAQLHPGASPGSAELVTPLSGTVVSVGVTGGEFVDSATTLVSVADLSEVLAVADIPEADATLVSPGDRAALTLESGGGQRWDSRVDALSATLDPHARTLPARFRLPNGDGALRGGMFMDAAIVSHRGRTGLAIPISAVQFMGDRRVAFTPLGGGRFQVHMLQLGVTQPDWAEVKTGLAAGDTVVTDGSFTLKGLLQQQLLGQSG